MSIWHKILLSIGIALMLLVGINGLFSPSTVLEGLNITVDNATARNEIRSAYGSLQIITALFMFFSLIGKLPASTGFAVMLAHIGGVFAGRLISLGVEGIGVFAEYSGFLKWLYVVDFIVTTLFVIAFFQALRSEQRVGS